MYRLQYTQYRSPVNAIEFQPVFPQQLAGGPPESHAQNKKSCRKSQGICGSFQHDVHVRLRTGREQQRLSPVKTAPMDEVEVSCSIVLSLSLSRSLYLPGCFFFFCSALFCVLYIPTCVLGWAPMRFPIYGIKSNMVCEQLRAASRAGGFPATEAEQVGNWRRDLRNTRTHTRILLPFAETPEAKARTTRLCEVL